MFYYAVMDVTAFCDRWKEVAQLRARQFSASTQPWGSYTKEVYVGFERFVCINIRTILCNMTFKNMPFAFYTLFDYLRFNFGQMKSSFLSGKEQGCQKNMFNFSRKFTQHPKLEKRV